RRRRGVDLGPCDGGGPAPSTTVEPGTEDTVTRIATEEETVTESFEAPETTTEDPEAPEGERTVVEPGVPGEREVTYSVTRVNGQETERERLDEQVLTEPRPEIGRAHV